MMTNSPNYLGIIAVNYDSFREQTEAELEVFCTYWT